MLKRFFYKLKHARVKENILKGKILISILGLVVSFSALAVSTWAWFTDTVSTQTLTIKAASYDMVISIIDKESVGDPIELSGKNMNYILQPNKEYKITLKANGTAKSGFCKIKVGEKEYYTNQISTGTTLTFTISSVNGDEIEFIPTWGKYNEDSNIKDNIIYGNTTIAIGNIGELYENIEKPAQNTEDKVTKVPEEQSFESGEVEDSKTDSLTPEVNENQESIIEKEDVNKQPELEEEINKSDNNEVLEEDSITSEDNNVLEKEELPIETPDVDTENEITDNNSTEVQEN